MSCPWCWYPTGNLWEWSNFKTANLAIKSMSLSVRIFSWALIFILKLHTTFLNFLMLVIVVLNTILTLNDRSLKRKISVRIFVNHLIVNQFIGYGYTVCPLLGPRPFVRNLKLMDFSTLGSRDMSKKHYFVHDVLTFDSMEME